MNRHSYFFLLKIIGTCLFCLLLILGGCTKSEVVNIVSYDDDYGTQKENTIVAKIGTTTFTSVKDPLPSDTVSAYGTGAFLKSNGRSILFVGIAEYLGSYERIQFFINLKTTTDVRGDYPIAVTKVEGLNGYGNYAVFGNAAVGLTYPNSSGPVGFTSTGKITITNKTGSYINGRFEFVQGYAGVVTRVTQGTFYKLKIK